MDMDIARIRADGMGQPLIDHLTGVGCRAADFAQAFQAADWARLAGLWHDLGKHRPGFQRYIHECADANCQTTTTGSAKTHSAAGALWALEKFSDRHIGRVFAYLIAGHHSGLVDWVALQARMAKPESRRELDEALESAPGELFDIGAFSPDPRAIPGGAAGFHLWLRMLFSSLVDADFLDTEAFMDQDKALGRDGFPPLTELAASFDAHMAKLAQNARPGRVNTLRAEILAQCRSKAQAAPGVFTLTVPTGGGKTLSSMAFALDHAKKNGQRRIIYAIPYTSIIEQTADVFREVFGAQSLVEHHSNADAAPDKEDHRTRLACENWDAPLVVTTNVQLFESLFAARTSRCRKLHNLANSVIVLDEAQLLNPEFLQPIIDVLKLLTQYYGVTLVLCTATQPALSSRKSFDPKRGFHGFDQVPEIADDPAFLYEKLQRVKVNLPADLQTPRSWDSLADEIGQHDCVLAIVNTKNSAHALWRRLPKGALYLSALMCGQHRSDVIKQIGQRLASRRATLDTADAADAAAGAPLRVVSTQLIEAGVDVDFPVVYRALAGLDSLAQAAGRCNREGRLAQGEVFVFIPPVLPPRGLLRKGAEACERTLHGNREDPLALHLFPKYFEKLYANCDLDLHNIADLVACGRGDDVFAVKFATAAEKFKLIDDSETAGLIVRYHGLDDKNQEIDQLLALLNAEGPRRWLMRKLQRYTVTLYAKDLLRLQQQGDVLEHFPGLYVQVGDVLYERNFGVNVDGFPGDPAAMVC